MKKLLAVAAVMAGGLVFAPVAGADTSSFLNDVRNQGIQGSDNTLVDWGSRVCNDNRAGWDSGTIINNLDSNTGMTLADSKFFFEAASIWLC